MKFGSRMKQLIKDAGFGQNEFALILGVSESTLSRWIMKDVPELDGIVAICQALNVPLSRFFSDKNDDVQILSDQDKELLNLFHKATPRKQSAILEFLSHILQ